MWLKKIKHKKMQMFLVGLVLFATTVLCTMCIAFTLELNSFAQKGITEKNCPDLFVFDSGTDGFKQNLRTAEVKDNLENVKSIAGKTISVPILYEGNDISLYDDSLLDASKYSEFGFITKDDPTQNLPNAGEVWLSKTVSEPNHIKIGDTITLQYETHKNLKVVGIFDSTFLPKSMAITPMLGNIKDINELENAEPAALHAVNLRIVSEEKENAVFDADPYMKMGITRDSVRQCLTEISTMMGGFGSMAGIIVFIVALIIIRFIIKTNLIKEYKAIGVYKSLGYTSKKIRSFYLKGYLLIGLISITLGAACSLALVYPIGKICTEYVPGFGISSTSLVVCGLVIVVLMILLYLNLILALKRAKKITPVEAIAVGITSAEKKIKRSLIKSAKSPLSMAVNDMFKYKRSTIMMLLVLTVSLFLSMVFVMGYSSSSHMAQKSNLWFALPKEDAYVSGDITDEVRNYIGHNQYVKSSVYGECLYTPEELKINGKYGDDIKMSYINFSVLDHMDAGVTGVKMSQGTAPGHVGETALGVNLIKLLHVKVGDYIKMEICGVEKQYLVTGSFQSMMSSGYGVMLLEKDVLACDSNYKTSRAYVCLNSKKDIDLFKKDMETRFPGVSVDDNWNAIENSVASIELMLTSVSSILVGVFIIFSLLNTTIVITMDLKNQRRKYGILKSLGFTTSYMIRQNLCKYSIIIGISIVIATALHKLISARLFGVMVIDAFRDNNLMLTALVAGFALISIMVAWLLSRSIKKITPIELMEE